MIERMLSKEAEGPVPAAGAAAAPAGLPEMRQPLLAEEAPTPPTQRAGLATALAIVRWDRLRAARLAFCPHRAGGQRWHAWQMAAPLRSRQPAAPERQRLPSLQVH